jgi:hypothetical protein
MLPPYNQIICEITPSDNESGLYCQHGIFGVELDEVASKVFPVEKILWMQSV